MKFEDQTFQSILTDPTTGKNGLVIPEYQRHYAWDAKATRQFLDDLKDETQSRTSSTEDDEQPHVGAIILHQDRKTGEINVVDGQQRLTTLTLLVAMLRRECQHHAVNISDASLREKFQDVAGQCKALLFIDEDDCEEIRLGLLDEDQPHLSSLLTGKALTEGDLPRSKLPAVAAAIRAWISEEIANLNSDQALKRLREIRDMAREVRFSVGKTSSFDRAIAQYERVNNRGVDLTPSELVKHKLIQTATSARRPEVRKAWTKLETEAHTLGGSGLIDVLHQSWNAHFTNQDNSKAQSDGLKATKSRIHHRYIELMTYSSNMTPLDVTRRLQTDLHRLLLCKDESDSEQEMLRSWHASGLENIDRESLLKTEESLRFMVQSGFRQCMPLILALWEYRPVDLHRFVQLADSIQTRRSSIADRRNNIMDGIYVRAALAIRKGVDSNIIEDDIRAQVPDTPDDAMIRTLIVSQEFRSGNSQVAKKILERLYTSRAIIGSKPGISLKIKHIHLEHIAPQVPTAYWIDVFGSRKQAIAYSQRLGNQILLESRLNQQVGQLPFEQKREKFSEDSLIRHPLNVIRFDKWSAREIDIRGAELAELIIKVWPL